MTRSPAASDFCLVARSLVARNQQVVELLAGELTGAPPADGPTR